MIFLTKSGYTSKVYPLYALVVLLLCHTMILCESLSRKKFVKRQGRSGSELSGKSVLFLIL